MADREALFGILQSSTSNKNGTKHTCLKTHDRTKDGILVWIEMTEMYKFKGSKNESINNLEIELVLPMEGEDLNDVTAWIDNYQTGTCTLVELYSKELAAVGDESAISDNQNISFKALPILTIYEEPSKPCARYHLGESLHLDMRNVSKR